MRRAPLLLLVLLATPLAILNAQTTSPPAPTKPQAAPQQQVTPPSQSTVPSQQSLPGSQPPPVPPAGPPQQGGPGNGSGSSGTNRNGTFLASAGGQIAAICSSFSGTCITLSFEMLLRVNSSFM